MVPVTAWVPRAASATLRAISWVATCCSSTAAATPSAMLCTLPMVEPISLMAATVSRVASWIMVICAVISSVARAV